MEVAVDANALARGCGVHDGVGPAKEFDAAAEEGGGFV